MLDDRARWSLVSLLSDPASPALLSRPRPATCPRSEEGHTITEIGTVLYESMTETDVSEGHDERCAHSPVDPVDTIAWTLRILAIAL
jgi:hypothetical protein